MKNIFPFLKPYKLQLIVGPLFKLTEAVLELLIPTLMALLIDKGINGGDNNYIVKIGLFMILTATFGVVSALICQYSASIASQGFGTDLRNAMFKKITSFSFEDLDKYKTSSLINRITGDVNQLQSAVAMLIRLVIRAPFLCIGCLIMAISIDLKLSIIFMIVIPLFVLILFLVMFKAVPLYKSVQKKLDKLTLVLRENLSGVRVIRAFTQTNKEKTRFCDANDIYCDTAIKVGKIAALTNPATTIIMNMAVVAVIWFGGIRVNTGSMTQGQIIAFINYITQLLNAMIVVANLVILYTKAYASANRVSEILSVNPSVQDGEDISYLKMPIIKFDNVSFKYKGAGGYALENINLEINKGETIGIIGGTGSGKTSLINLIPRFYDATKGRVFVNGCDVRNYPLKHLRDMIGVVQQRANLFSGSIEYNLKMAKEDATYEEMRKAAQIAQATEFIDKFENGFKTYISQGGSNLSGGQKQRLTIARTLVKNPEILILDDSASALDYVTDANLRKAIKDNTKDMTVIIVSQRVNSIRDADKIIVLDDGEIIGEGVHNELYENCEIYREICISQEQGKEAI